MTSTEDPLEIFRSSAVPCMAIGADEKIHLFNDAAARLFGTHAERALGRACHEVVQGCDIFGNRYCVPGCPLLCMARSTEAVRPTEIVLCPKVPDLAPRRLAVLSLVVPTPDERLLVHLFHEPSVALTSPDGLRPRSSTPPLAVSPTQPALTERERQVLRMIAEAASTREIADRLSISTATVRNHVQHILDKLGVSGKLEAVLFAKRHGLL